MHLAATLEEVHAFLLRDHDVAVEVGRALLDTSPNCMSKRVGSRFSCRSISSMWNFGNTSPALGVLSRAGAPERNHEGCVIGLKRLR